MKRLALMVLMLAALASPAFAQYGGLGLFSDVQGNSCNLTDAGGTIQVHVFHILNPGEESSGSRWKMVPPAGAVWVYLAFSSTFSSIGQADSDISIGYSGCLTTTTYLGMAFWTSAVPGGTCTYVTITAPLGGEAEGTDCDFAAVILRKSGVAIVNPDAGCQCNIPTQPSTWGQVKALYR